MPSDSTDPDRIERDLAQTRARMGSHLNQLQDRLSPGQVIDDAMAYFRGSEGADFGRNLLASVRNNPLPAALTGIGLAWLMASSGKPAPADHPDFETRLRDIDSQVTRGADEADHAYTARLTDARSRFVGVSRESHDTDQSFGDRVQGALASARQAAADAAASLRDKAGSAASGVSGSASNALSAVGSSVSSAAGSVQSAAGRAGSALYSGGQSAGQVGGNAVSALTDNPMLLGALGLAAGALLGSLLPKTETEEELLGGVAQQARSTAEGLASTAMERGGSVAQAMLDAGKESAGRTGLTQGASSPGDVVDKALGGDLASSAKTVAQDVMKAGEAAVKKELPKA